MSWGSGIGFVSRSATMTSLGTCFRRISPCCRSSLTKLAFSRICLDLLKVPPWVTMCIVLRLSCPITMESRIAIFRSCSRLLTQGTYVAASSRARSSLSEEDLVTARSLKLRQWMGAEPRVMTTPA